MLRNSPILKLLITMSVPSIVGMLVTSVYNMADTYFVHYLGTSATGAVGINYSVELIIMMAGSFLAVGSNSYIARLLGAGEKEHASKVLSTAFFTAMLIGAAVAVFGLVFLREMVTALGATPTVLPYAEEYGKYLLYAAPFMAANFVMNQCLRSEGNATYSMIGMAAGGILNIALDPLFMFTLDLGIAGAAIATSISKFVSFIILIMPYIRRKSILRLSVANVRYNFADSKEVVTVGSSSLFRTLFGVISGILINKAAGAYSDSCLAAISATTKIMSVPFSIFLGFGQGFQPVCGFNWGAKLYARVKESFRTASVIAMIMPIFIAVGIGIFAEQVIALFTETDAELIRIGKVCLISQCIALPAHSWCVVVNMAYAGTGKAKGAFFLSISRQGSFFLPLVFLLPALFAENGVALVQGAADFLSLCLAIPLAIKFKKEVDTRVALNGELPKTI